MLESFLLIGAMLFCAVAPMIWMTWGMVQGKSGLVLTVMSLLGAVFVILFYATKTPIGIDFVQAWALAGIVALPAFLGGLAGTVLGWLIRRRRDRRP